MNESIAEILFSEESIARRVNELGARISRDYRGKKLTAVCVLKGAAVFFADLVRKISAPVEFAFITASSYGAAAVSKGEAEVSVPAPFEVCGKDVLLVEDIADTGVTLSCLRERFLKSGARSVKICALLNKPSRRRVKIEPDYVGFEVEDEFVVGYGMDFAEDYRNLPYIGVLSRSVYEE